MLRSDIAIIIKEAMGYETELQTTTYLDEINENIVTEEVERALL